MPHCHRWEGVAFLCCWTQNQRGTRFPRKGDNFDQIETFGLFADIFPWLCSQLPFCIDEEEHIFLKTKEKWLGLKTSNIIINCVKKDTNYLASRILRLSLQERWEVCRRCKRQFQIRIGDGVSSDEVEATTSAAVLRLSDEKRSRIGGRWSGGWASKESGKTWSRSRWGPGWINNHACDELYFRTYFRIRKSPTHPPQEIVLHIMSSSPKISRIPATRKILR